MSLQVGDRVEHLTHNTAYGPGTVIKVGVGVEKIAVIWQRKDGEINYYKDGRYAISGPIVIKSLVEPVNCTMIPNLGYLFTLECGTRILKTLGNVHIVLPQNDDL